MPGPGNSQRAVSTRQPVITIDGPAGVGKSTAAKLLARRMKLTYLDTGATYRVLAYAALQQDRILLEDPVRLAAMAAKLPFELRRQSSGALRVTLEGKNVTRLIRTDVVSEAAAQLSRYPSVRMALVRRQRRLASRHGVVVEGRDTGSVVFPKATHKFFLSADLSVRARRRQRELRRLYGMAPSLARVQAQLLFRDRIDRTRRVGRLIRPKRSIAIDTSRLTARHVVRSMFNHIRRPPAPAVRTPRSFGR